MFKSLHSKINRLNLSPKQKIILLGLLFLLISIPSLVFVSQQSTELRKKASASNIIPNEAVLGFQVPPKNSSTRSAPVFLHLDTHSTTIDGVQVIAHFQTGPELQIRDDSFKLSAHSQNYFTFANNSIERLGPHNYRLTLTLLPKNRSNGYHNYQDTKIASFNLYLQPSSGPKPYRGHLRFDKQKTKVITLQHGQDIAKYLPSSNIELTYPQPTEHPPSPTPSKITPIPSPSPTPTKLYQIKIRFQLEGYPESSPSSMPQVSTTLWNSKQNRIHYPRNSRLQHNQLTNQFTFSADYDIEPSTPFTFYINPQRHAIIKHAGVIHQENIPGRFIDIEKPLLAGEITRDSYIDIQDYHVLVRQFDPTTTKKSVADLNYDGRVDIHDYQLLVKNFNPNYAFPQSPLQAHQASPTPHYPPGSPVPSPFLSPRSTR